MKKLIILCTIVALSSCTNGENTTPIDSNNNYKDIGDFGVMSKAYPNLKIITIDSCEYISFNLGSNNGLLTHKGNCRNCRKK